jgi:nucleoside-diphosphate-sugar epimerase
MPNNKPKILVLGATGQVGKNVISHLITNDKVELIAAARSPEKAKDLGVPVVYLDLDKPESIAVARRWRNSPCSPDTGYVPRAARFRPRCQRSRFGSSLCRVRK